MPAVPASIKLTAFICPHCGTFTTQHWYSGYAKYIQGDSNLPDLVSAEFVDSARKDLEKAPLKEDMAALKKHLPTFERMASGVPILSSESAKLENVRDVHNLHFSSCYECRNIAIWRHDTLLYPPTREGPAPNVDMPADVLRDYEEARSILNFSPRGSAALLRLVIEKLVEELQAIGPDLNAKIAWLVANGLPVEIQQALDVVRVIGNESVHPGSIDLRDDRDTALELFELVNFIVDDRISRPKRIKAAYSKLPDAKRKGIAERDKPRE